MATCRLCDQCLRFNVGLMILAVLACDLHTATARQTKPGSEEASPAPAGKKDKAPDLTGPVLINEVVTNPGLNGAAVPGDTLPAPWVELVNNGSAPVDLANWVLSSKKEVARGWTMPSAVLKPGQFLVVFVAGRAPAGLIPNNTLVTTSLVLKKGGDKLYLYNPSGDLVSTTGTMRPQKPGYSWGLPGTATAPANGTAALPSTPVTVPEGSIAAAASFAYLVPTPGGPNTPAVPEANVNATSATQGR